MVKDVEKDEEDDAEAEEEQDEEIEPAGLLLLRLKVVELLMHRL